MHRRHELTDTQWERLQPLLPAEKPRVGKPNLPHRRIINGILWRLKTGASWPLSRPRPMLQAMSTGPCTSWMAAWSAPTSMRLGLKRGGATGAGTESRRLQHEDPRPARPHGEAARLRPDGWTATRADRPAPAHGAGRSQARWSWST